MADFVDAYSKTTGKKQAVPAHWLEPGTPDVPPYNGFQKTKPRVEVEESLQADNESPATPATKKKEA